MSSIKSARADFVKTDDLSAIMITMSFDEGRQSIFLTDKRIIQTFVDDADSSLTAALATISLTQGTPAMPNVYPIDKLKATTPEDQAFVDEAQRVLKDQVAIAEWYADAA